MTELWKDIKGFEGAYQVSSLGRVRSLDRKVRNKNGFSSKKASFITPHWRGRETKGKSPKTNPLRYMSVGLWEKKKQYNFTVHRLVALAFIPNPQEKPEVNHIDGNRENNKASNLEWCTRQENVEHAIKSGLHMPYGEDHHGAKLNWEKVKEIREKYVPRKYSQHRLAREYGVNQDTIHSVVNNLTWIIEPASLNDSSQEVVSR